MLRHTLAVGLLPLLILCAAPGSVQAHVHTAPMLDGAALDGGLHIAVKHPRLVREAAPFDVRVIVNNIAGAGPVMVGEIRYMIQGPIAAATHRPQRTLESACEAYEQYRATQEALREAVAQHDRIAVAELSAQSRGLLQRLAAGAFVDVLHIDDDLIPRAPGTSLRLDVEIDLIEEGALRTITRAIEIPVHPPLPRGGSLDGIGAWFAGDQHLHTLYSLDAVILNGTTENTADYAATAELMGQDWIIVTDHSNVHVNWGGIDYYTPDQFAAGTVQAADYTAQHDFLALYSQELGLGSYGFWNLPSHMIALPWQSDSTGYMENPSSGLVFGLANCEPEQVIIDRIANAGGLGFIAHPYDSGDLAYVAWNWNNGATGWAGLEIFNSEDGAFGGTDQQSVDKWHELLNDIAPPTGGQLADRPGFPTKFPVGLGNSDAHEPGQIAAAFSYAWLDGPVTRAAVAEAFIDGRCVATNGPLVFGSINGAGTGEVATIPPVTGELELTLQTTSEFGPVGDYQVTIFVNGASRKVIPPSGEPGFELMMTIDDLALAPPDKFVTIRADSTAGAWLAIANPIWLEYGGNPADVNGDGVVDVLDLLAVLAAWGGPGAGGEDVNGDGIVDVLDLLEVLANWG